MTLWRIDNGHVFPIFAKHLSILSFLFPNSYSGVDEDNFTSTFEDLKAVSDVFVFLIDNQKYLFEEDPQFLLSAIRANNFQVPLQSPFFCLLNHFK